MYFIGLDLSLCSTGVAILDELGEPIYLSRIVSSDLRGLERLIFIKKQIEEILNDIEIECIAIEGYSYGSQGRAIFNIGEIGGIVRIMIFERGIKMMIVPPSIVKMFVGAKGNAKKEVVIQAYNDLYSAFFRKCDNDEVDALILSKIAYYYNHRIGITNSQYELVKKLEEKCEII